MSRIHRCQSCQGVQERTCALFHARLHLRKEMQTFRKLLFKLFKVHFARQLFNLLCFSVLCLRRVCAGGEAELGRVRRDLRRNRQDSGGDARRDTEECKRKRLRKLATGTRAAAGRMNRVIQSDSA